MDPADARRRACQKVLHRSRYLLDLDNPAKVIGRLREPLIAPDASEREGYVPNVVYTCGAIAHNGRLIVPVRNVRPCNTHRKRFGG